MACELFIKEKGLDLLERNLYRNYIVHLDSMFNYGLISPHAISSNIQKLTDILHENFEQLSKLKIEREIQLKNWLMKKNTLETRPEIKSSVDTSCWMKSNAKEDRLRACYKTDAKDLSKAKVSTRHSDVNVSCQVLSGATKQKSNFKRKMST